MIPHRSVRNVRFLPTSRNFKTPAICLHLKKAGISLMHDFFLLIFLKSLYIHIFGFVSLALPRSTLVFSGQYEIISNAPLVNP